MKRITFLASLGITLVSFTSCEQDNRVAGCSDPFAINFNPSVQVSDDNGSCVYPIEQSIGFLTDFTATWCGPCGDWGAPAFKEANEQVAGSAYSMAVHASGSDYACAESEAMNDAFGISGIPTLMANFETDASSAGPLVSAVNSFITEKPDVSSAAIVDIKQDQVNVVAQARWFAPMTGQVYLAVYVVEDSIVGQQNFTGGYQSFVHDHVLRMEGSSQAFGTQVLNGEAWSGKTETIELSFELNNSWRKDKLSYITVLWREGLSGKEFLNVSEAIPMAL